MPLPHAKIPRSFGGWISLRLQVEMEWGDPCLVGAFDRDGVCYCFSDRDHRSSSSQSENMLTDRYTKPSTL